MLFLSQFQLAAPFINGSKIQGSYPTRVLGKESRVLGVADDTAPEVTREAVKTSYGKITGTQDVLALN